MRVAVLVTALALVGGCWHTDIKMGSGSPPQVAYSPPPKPGTVGNSHLPYLGRPPYLASARPLRATTSAQQAPEAQCQKRSPECDDRLRAALAGLDAQILSLTTPPTPAQLQALQLSANELGPLLVPYPDIGAEREELQTIAGRLATTPAAQLDAAKRRMQELTDLIRVQLAAAE